MSSRIFNLMRLELYRNTSASRLATTRELLSPSTTKSLILVNVRPALAHHGRVRESVIVVTDAAGDPIAINSELA